jgi:DNA-binding beta-propeller fold protein YncE
MQRLVGEAVMRAHATSAARLGVLLAAALCAILLVVGCGTSGSGSTDNGATPPQTDASTVATPAGGSDGSGDKIAASIAATPAATVDRAEIERRLALPRFTYVGETDYQGAKGSNGTLAFIDSQTDTLAFRPRIGSDLGRVAVSPDGRLIYVGDQDEPVLWVVDAETHEKVGSIRLPGVSSSKRQTMTTTAKYPYAQLQTCSSAVACTPDGALVLVLSKAGLQVIDAASAEVVRTLPELRDGAELAVSFDGKRAYIATTDALTRGRHTLADWRTIFMSGGGGGLALLDLETWQIVKQVSCGVVGGIAVDPDDSRIFCSDYRRKALRIVDPVTLADLAVVSLKSAKFKHFLPAGVGVLPDGSKVYVVCTALVPSDPWTMANAGPMEFFCAVVATESQEVVKRIPLDAY